MPLFWYQLSECMKKLKKKAFSFVTLVFEFAATVLAPKDWNNYLSLSMHESIT